MEPRSIHVGFVVEKVALRQVPLRIIRFFPFIIPPWLTLLIYHAPMNNRPVGACRSETVSSYRHEQQQQQQSNLISI